MFRGRPAPHFYVGPDMSLVIPDEDEFFQRGFTVSPEEDHDEESMGSDSIDLH